MALNTRMSSSALSFGLAAMILSCQLASGQHTHVQAVSGGPAKLPVLVDGAKTPDKIPDSLAYEHYFTALSVPATATAQDKDRQAAQLDNLQLALADRQTIVGGIATFRAQLDRIAYAAGPASTADDLLALRAQKAALVNTTLSTLRQAMTAQGAARLDQYIQGHVKSHIVIFGGTK